MRHLAKGCPGILIRRRPFNMFSFLLCEKHPNKMGPVSKKPRIRFQCSFLMWKTGSLSFCDVVTNSGPTQHLLFRVTRLQGQPHPGSRGCPCCRLVMVKSGKAVWESGEFSSVYIPLQRWTVKALLPRQKRLQREHPPREDIFSVAEGNKTHRTFVQQLILNLCKFCWLLPQCNF